MLLFFARKNREFSIFNMKNLFRSILFVVFALVFFGFYGFLFAFNHPPKTSRVSNLNIENVRRPRRVWSNRYGKIDIEPSPFLKAIDTLAAIQEEINKNQQEIRDRIYREKLAILVRGVVLRDFWTTRFKWAFREYFFLLIEFNFF